MSDIEEESWHEISEKLANYFQICSCQRKIKSIVDNLLAIKKKCIDAYELDTPRDFTGAEWLIIAQLDSFSNSVTHGINCEYPIINKHDEFWVWLDKIKDNKNLIDN